MSGGHGQRLPLWLQKIYNPNDTMQTSFECQVLNWKTLIKPQPAPEHHHIQTSYIEFKSIEFISTFINLLASLFFFIFFMTCLPAISYIPMWIVRKTYIYSLL